MRFRDYDPGRDREAVHRIWREIGWIEKKKEQEAMDLFLESSRAMVAEVNSEAESLVATATGSIRYLKEDLTLSALAGVTTGRIARKRGLASQLAAMAIARDAAQGALVSALGMFEQGYYNQLGFGTGGYEHWCSFDPAQLEVELSPRIPRRITPDDWEGVHSSRLSRNRGHGSCNLEAARLTQSEMLWSKNGFGLGYCDGAHGELTHHFWYRTEDVECGPYSISWMAYQNRDQFLELLALLKSLGDQVRLVRVREPQGIQLQDLLKKPFKMRQVSEKSKYESRMRASAYWQVRICDLNGCLERTHLARERVRFNLILIDPIEGFLEKDAPWRGVAGNYVVTLGPFSEAEPGTDATLPTLNASVGAFTRMWLGVRPATGLSWTDELSAPEELLEALDQVLQLPDPKLDWDF